MATGCAGRVWSRSARSPLLNVLAALVSAVGRAPGGAVDRRAGADRRGPRAGRCPGKFGPAQVTLAAAGVDRVVADRLICWPVAKHEASSASSPRPPWSGAGVLLAAGAEFAVAAAAGRHRRRAASWSALLVTVQAAQLSALWARFPLPVIPAPGDPTPSAPSLRVLEDLPRRVRISDAHQTGFIAGAVLLSVLGSVADRVATRDVVVLGLVRGGRDRRGGRAAGPGVGFGRLQGVAAGQPYLVGVASGGALHRDRALRRRLVWRWCLPRWSSAWAVVALNPAIAAPETYSLPMRRLLGFVASGIDASLIPVIAYLVGLFAWVLNR